MVSQILTLFQTQKYHFPHLFSDQISKIHTSFQTWPLGINYVIITDVRAQTKKFFKSMSNLHISLSFFEMINTFIHYTHFQTKRAKNHTLWGGTYLIHDTFRLCTCLRTGGLKVMPCGFLASKQVINSANSQSSLSILDNKKGRTFHVKDIYKLWVEVIIVTFVDAVVTIDVLTASNNDVKY